MPTILTFGDSNTHGTPPIVTPGVYARFPAGTRWPTVMAAELGPKWTLVEESLPGRTAQFPDPIMGPHMEGTSALRIALESHGPIDVLTIMLGTNDTKNMFGATPEKIAGGMDALLRIARSEPMQTRHGGFKILLICPPPVKVQGPISDQFLFADTKGKALPPLYKTIAAHHGVGYMDAGKVIETSAIDGVHFDEADHPKLGQAVANAVRAL